MGWKKNSIIKFDYEKLYPDTIPKPRTLKAWDKSKYKNIKKFIRFHHAIVQNDQCAFCRTPIRMNGYGEAIEHIVPKSIKPSWMFHPKNLVLACYGCNTKKHQENTLLTPVSHGDNYLNYPKDKGDFTIIHPHFDKFSAHININGLLFSATLLDPHSKGKNTINICKLNRLDAIYDRARAKGVNRNQLYKSIRIILSDPNSSKEEINDAQNMINILIDRYNYIKKLYGR